MLLTGTHDRTLDEKKRIALPKKIRQAMRNPKQVYVTPGPDKCLWVYTQQGLESLATRLDASPATDAEARVFRRLYFAQTECVEFDTAGRVLIPERLMQFAGLEKEVVVLGVRDHLEVWDQARWQAYMANYLTNFDAVAEKAFPEK